MHVIALVWRSEDRFHELVLFIHHLPFLVYFMSFAGFGILFIVYLGDSFSSCSPLWPGVCYVEQAGLELIETSWPLLPECWD